MTPRSRRLASSRRGAARPGPGLHELVVVYQAGLPGTGCFEPNGVRVVREDPAEVVLEASTVTTGVGEEGKPCLLVARTVEVRVTLSADLGSRRLIDAAALEEGEPAQISVAPR